MNARLSTEVFDVIKMERLKHFLESNAERNKARYYEIYVDNLKVVDKTNDPALFDDYTIYMNEDTRMIRVLMYSCSETSPRNDKFIFTVNNPDPEKEHLKKQELSGIEVQGKIEAALQQERDRHELESIKDNLSYTENELKDAEKYIDELKAELTACREAKGLQHIKWGEVASAMINSTINQNPQWLQNIPFIGNLAGLLVDSSNNQQPGLEGHQTVQGSASFAKMNAEADNNFNETDKKRLLFLRHVETTLDSEQFEQLMTIMHSLTASPDTIKEVYGLLFGSETEKN